MCGLRSLWGILFGSLGYLISAFKDAHDSIAFLLCGRPDRNWKYCRSELRGFCLEYFILSQSALIGMARNNTLLVLLTLDPRRGGIGVIHFRIACVRSPIM